MRKLYQYLLLVFAILPSAVFSMAGTDTVYQSDQLIITRLAKHSYVHTSYLYTNSFGKVPCNGMIVLNKNEAVVFDTPANDTSTTELINWIENGKTIPTTDKRWSDREKEALEAGKSQLENYTWLKKTD